MRVLAHFTSLGIVRIEGISTFCPLGYIFGPEGISTFYTISSLCVLNSFKYF